MITVLRRCLAMGLAANLAAPLAAGDAAKGNPVPARSAPPTATGPTLGSSAGAVGPTNEVRGRAASVSPSAEATSAGAGMRVPPGEGKNVPRKLPSVTAPAPLPGRSEAPGGGESPKGLTATSPSIPDAQRVSSPPSRE